MCCIGASLSNKIWQFLHNCPSSIPQQIQQTTPYIYTPMVKAQVRLFSGERDPSGHVEDPETWLNHFEMMSVTNGWNTDILKKQHFPVYLTGEAEAWYMVYRAWINTAGTTWAQIKATMTTRFRPNNYAEE